jgi:3-keto-5-aminohexanoate cleavage enzyme
MEYWWDYKDPYKFDKLLRNGMPPLMISVAITGGAAGKEVNPNLPEKPEEQAREAYEAYNAGACSVHIHARDPQRGYAYSSTAPEHYFEINRRIRDLCPDIIINNTTGGGVGGLKSEERMRSLGAKPEVASLNCGPLILRAVLPKRRPPLSGRDDDLPLDDFIIPVTVGEVERYAKAMLEKMIKPELEVYNSQ